MSWQLAAGMAGAQVLNSWGQAEANRQSLQSVHEQMDFQERMANSAHQRQVSDLRAAGLNPILSANSGASSPTGASYTAQNEMEGITTTAKGALDLKQAKDLMAQQKLAQDKVIEKQDKEIGVLGSQEALNKNTVSLQNAQSQASLAAAKKSDVEARVAAKGIPRAEITNDIYKEGRKFYDAAKSRIQNFFQTTPSKNQNLENYKKYKENLK